MVHVDPEDDTRGKPSVALPGREQLLRHLREHLNGLLPEPEKVVLHYLEGAVEVELFLPPVFCAQPEQVRKLKAGIDRMVTQDGFFRAVHLHRCSAP
jgi:hypothetical protein